MIELIDRLKPEDWLKMNAQLQQKKRAVRAELAEKGVLEKKGKNDYDHYRYFSEAQYKELFTRLLSKHGLEIGFSEESYDLFEAAGKNCNGRLAKLRFFLHDTETGFYETTLITGEGADKGDKGGYKAYTGALKYFLADTFMVATGDDAEKESPEMNPQKTITKAQEEKLTSFAGSVGVTPEQICRTFKVGALADMTPVMWKRAIEMLEKESEKRGV